MIPIETDSPTAHRAPRTAAALSPTPSAPLRGLKFARVFSQKAISPFDEIEWEQRTAEITDDSGKAIFKQRTSRCKVVERAARKKIASRNTSTAISRTATIRTRAAASVPSGNSSTRHAHDRDCGIKDGYFADKEARKLSTTN